MPGDASEGTAGPTPATDARVGLPVAVLAVLAAVVVALLAVWGTTALQAPRLPTGPALDPPEGAPPASSTFTIDDRDVRLDEFRMTLAGPPFSCGPVTSPPTAFPEFLYCSHVVHRDYDAAGDDWAATTGVALLDGSVVKPSLDGTAKAAFAALVDASFKPEDHARVEVDPTPAQLALPADRSATYSAKVVVQRKGLPTPYDRVVVAVLKLKSGQHVAFFSDFPHDGDQAALKAVVASVSSLSLSG